MADSFPKPILPYLEGKAGALRMMRFWSKVDVRSPEECWEWQASLNGRGYGRFKIASYVSVTASRFALISHKEDEGGGLHVLHKCDNRKCCNPHHLYFGTQSQNMRDRTERDRCNAPSQVGFKNNSAKLDERQLALVVTRLQEGWTNKAIAEDLPITHSMVSLIRRGKMWTEQTADLGWNPNPVFTRKAA